MPGFLNRLFGEESEERRLQSEKEAALAAMGLPAQQAREMARETVKKAVEICKSRGVHAKPPSPNELWERAKVDPKIAQYLEILEQEGVTEENIQEWYSISHLERAVMEVDDEIARMGLFMDRLKKGDDSAAAASTVRRYFPMWGDPSDTTHATGADRPLPIELKLREIRWKERVGYAQPDTIRERLDSFTSYNAMIRDAIRKGEM